MSRLYAIAFLIVATAALSCSGEQSNRTRSVVAEVATASDAVRPAIVFMGTSLTAGYGLDQSQAYPAFLQRKIDSAGLEYRVVNAGLSGEASAGALRRVDWLFRQPVALLVIETGANDGLRGQDPAQLKANLQAVIDRARRQEPPPALLIVGMEAPPNLGPAYTRSFRAVYRDVAQENQARLVPFLLEGVAGVDSLNQADGIHPTPRGQAIMAETVWRVLEPMLEEQAVGSRR
ncbi:MAG: arylesterase [Gemmatimonadales bacterium]|nr:MAG: arylesterase [Gemmatimonadales bacterium]